MSRFFRSGNSGSSASSTSSDRESTPDDAIDDEIPAPTLNSLARTVPATASNKDLLLHALLEERCRNDVRQDATRRGLSLDESELSLQARKKYESLSAELARLGVVDDGPAGHDRAPIREQVLRGLDMLSNGTRSMVPSANVTAALPRLLIDAGPMADGGVSQHLTGPHLQPPALLGLSSFSSQGPTSRYAHDFEEIDMIGKGGYGSVYACKHRLDNVIYAVKKIALPSTTEGRPLPEVSSEADALLNEVRMLARLDHPNIVRYHNGWIDWTDLRASSSLPEADATSGAEDSRFSAGVSLGRIITETDTDDSHITFEDSGEVNSIAESEVHNSPTRDDGYSDQVVARPELPVTTSDQTEGTESVSRGALSETSGTDGFAQRIKGPCLALHIQMALYPMNLATFLTPPAQESESTLSHCFHLRPSVRILLAIIEGVDYLHRCNVVHRDLKPGNVFLEICPDSNKGTSVDLLDCGTRLNCRDGLSVSGVNGLEMLDDTHQPGQYRAAYQAVCHGGNTSARASESTPIRYLRIRIGDFGLATIRTASTPGVTSLDVGTALYQPPVVKQPHSPQLDIYALGIIAFELLWPFATRMERHSTLSAVKLGIFPHDFDARLGDGGQMRKCIGSMLNDPDITLSEARSELQSMLE